MRATGTHSFARIAAGVAAAILLCGQLATAGTITYSTPIGGMIQGEPVDAEAEFNVSAGTIDITLRNFLADPNSVKQVITGLYFEISSGQNTGTLDSILGPGIDIDSNGVATSVGSLTTEWMLSTSGSGLLLTILGGGQPDHGVIGPPNAGSGDYDNANGSIAGNGPHNPFMDQTGDFSISIAGLLESATITAVQFGFNTTGTDFIRGVPEPSSIVLVFAGLIGLWGFRRR